MIAEAAADHSSYYLSSLLEPLSPWLTRDDITDIYVNRPQEVWYETLGGAIEHCQCEALTERVLARLCRQIAAASAQGISRSHPLLAANLPDGSRVQVVAPPATRSGYALAIRRHIAADLSLGDYEAEGAFADVAIDSGLPAPPAELSTLSAGELRGALADAVRARKNILVSGGTSTGKTTFLNALLREVPPDQRLVVIEDTPELELRHRNSVGLVAVRGSLGEADVTAEDLLIAALRMRPDRILLGELRGREAFTFLRAVNTGHPGSMTTIHADSPLRAIEQLALLVLQASPGLRYDDICRYVKESVDIFVQLGRIGGRRKVTQVHMRAGL